VSTVAADGAVSVAAILWLPAWWFICFTVQISSSNLSHCLPCPPYRSPSANWGGLTSQRTPLSPCFVFGLPWLSLILRIFCALSLNLRCIAIEHAAGPMILVFILYLFLISALAVPIGALPKSF
jgi:hypothetical protein